jgi:hypothetical protein
MMAIMIPKRPIALPKISTIKILTKRDALCASARAAPLSVERRQCAEKGGVSVVGKSA